jgi:hypothetical protein
MREACRLAGTASAADGTAAVVCLAALSAPASSKAFVISSTNKRNAVSALNDVLPPISRTDLIVDKALNHGPNLMAYD